MGLLEYDYSKLDGRITEIFGSRRKSAEAIGRSERTVSLKMNNKIPFDQGEMEQSADVLNFPVEELGEYFFTRKVQNN